MFFGYTIHNYVNMINTKLQITLIISILSLLYACAPVVKDAPKKEPKVSKYALPKVVKAPEVAAPVIPPEQQNVLILLGGSTKPYQQVADYLIRELGEHAIQITLSGLPAQDVAVLKDIKISATKQIVAVGLSAVKAVKDFKDKQVIYTQVINHKNLIKDNVKGVSALPSPEKLFKDWKILSPGLSKVAIVTGKNLDLYLNRAKKAAKSQGIELIIEQVDSDKGFIYKSKKLKNEVGGQWILPDSRILSSKALKEVMSFSSRRGRQLVVFSPNLLSFGGFLYVSPDLEAVAKGLLQRLSKSAGEDVVVGDGVLPVLTHTMGINQNIARQLNLSIPQEYRKYINGK